MEDLFRTYDRAFKHLRDNPVTLRLEKEERKDGKVEVVILPDLWTHRQIFDPPLQHQRNSFTFAEILKVSRTSSVKTLAILGCGEMSLEGYLMHALRDRSVERILSVDVDENPLSRGLHCTREALSRHHETLAKRDAFPVVLDVYKGDVSEPSSSFVDVDVACATEVIEHMPIETATKLLRNVLLSIRPKTFILSTPNVEYNSAIGTKKFRHSGHHFEWTRAEFREWLEKNVPVAYSFRTEFVGNLRGHEDLGGATQFAVISKIKEVMAPCSLTSPSLQKVGHFILRYGWTRMVKNITVKSFLNFMEADNGKGIDGFPRCYDSYIHVPTEVIFSFRPPILTNFEICLKSFTDVLCELCHPFIFRTLMKKSVAEDGSSEDSSKNKSNNVVGIAIAIHDRPEAIRAIQDIYSRIK